MYTQRFGRVVQQQLAASAAAQITSSQSTQTQMTCPAAKSVSFHISPSTSPTSSNADVVELKIETSVQTDIYLDPNNTTLELRVCSKGQKESDELTTDDKAVQTTSSADSLSNKAIVDVPTSTKAGEPVLPSDIATNSGNATVTSPPKPVPTNILGVSNERGISALEEEERRKKEELLAKLRAIDGGKNPPESQPFQSVVKSSTQDSGSVDTSKHSQDSQPFLPEVGAGSVIGAKGSVQASTATSLENQGFLYNGERGPIVGGTQQTNQPYPVGGNSGKGSRNNGEGGQYHTATTAGMNMNSALIMGTQAIMHTSIHRQPGGPPAMGGTYTMAGSAQPLQVTGQPQHTMRGPVPLQATNEPIQTTGSSLQGVSTKQASLAALSGTQMTSGVSNLASLLGSSRRATLTEANELSKGFSGEGITKSSSSPSQSSWPDKIQNLHSGKPAYATDTDPFGSKYIARTSKDFSTLRSPPEYKPLHGRRAEGFKSFDKPLSAELRLISENHPGSNPVSKLNIKPRRESQSYPWEVPIDVQERNEHMEAVGKRRNTIKVKDQAVKGSLLPLRPKQSAGDTNYEAVSSSVIEPDDLEEVTL